jgi:hypothetical protein
MESRTSFMAALCRKRNTTVEKCFKAGDLTLDGFVERQADKCLHNRQIRSLEDPEDFYRRVRHFASEKAGGVPLDEIEQAVRTGVIATADHHGSIFCSQSFQGDILFHHLLKMLGYRGTVVPVLSSGQVELENSSYSRGFCVYTSPEKKLFYPLFPAKHSLRMVSQTGLVDAEMLKRFRRRFICQMEDEVTAGALDEICRLVYEPDDVQKAVRFGDQTSLTGLKLTGHLFPENDAPAFCYLEFEELIRPLLMRELSEGTSLLSGLLFDDGLRKNAGKLRLPDGTVLTDLMFKSADEKGTSCNRYFYEYAPLAGLGHFIHTYVCDGNPIPTFQGEPERVVIPNDIDKFTKEIWDNLNEDNKISLYVRYINIETKEVENRLINKNK